MFAPFSASAATFSAAAKVPPDVMPYTFGSWVSEASDAERRHLQDAGSWSQDWEDEVTASAAADIEAAVARAESLVPFGPGAAFDRAFARLTRGDQARGRGGFGLGLSIVRVIAEAHTGSAHARNLDVGADVWIVVPAVQAA